MDAQELRDWKAFCRSSSSLRPGDFYTLLMELNSRSELEQILETVDEAEQLRPGLLRLLRLEGGSEPISMDRQAQIEALLVRTLRELRRVVGDADPQIVGVLEHPRMRRVSREAWIETSASSGMWVKGEVMSRVGDTLRGALRPYSSVTSAFMEAIYGRVRDYTLVWAVLRPLMRNIEYDPEPSVLLWENAINYDLSEDGECVYCDLNPKFGGA